MRIEANRGLAGAGARGGAERGGGVRFHPLAGGTGARASAPVAAGGGVGSLEALLALQGVGVAMAGPRQGAVRHGRALLDALDALRADVLAGGAGAGALERLDALVGETRRGGDPGLDALLDDIELRVRVELAKSGRFPATRA